MQDVSRGILQAGISIYAGNYEEAVKAMRIHLPEQMRDIDRLLVRHGHTLLWGPGRRDPGDNVYSYLAGPDNFVVEYTTAQEQINDEHAWVPGIWLATPDYADRWGTARPGEDLSARWNQPPPEPGLRTAVPK